jgi:acetyltransferase-like isoleucine patch superfamily enzyme
MRLTNHRHLPTLLPKRQSAENARLMMGRGSYGHPLVKAYAGDTGRVTVGDFTSIAEEVVFLVGGNHRVDWVSTFPFRVRFGLSGAFADGHPATKGDIHVGNDVWIGRAATVMSGVTIGDGAVVGANAVVTQDVRAYAIVVGNPAREVKRRFNDATVEALERIAWWKWPIERILGCVDELNGDQVGVFIAKYEPIGRVQRA